MIPLAAAFTAGFLVCAGYTIRKIRQLRKVIRYNVDHALKQAVQRADCFELFCDECKRFSAPWWRP